MNWIDAKAQQPKRGTRVLTLWPLLKYDDAGDQLTDRVAFYSMAVVEYEHSERFDDPPYSDAVGSYFGDDYEYAEQPSHWMDLPALPEGVPAPEETV